jgi:hypothetical protein
MATGKKGSKTGTDGIGDAAVRAATGRSWAQWFRLIDAAGGRRMDHRGIVAVVGRKGARPWWQQMVTVAYERACGLRERYQTPAGYQAGRSRTIQAPLSAVYGAWTDPAVRRRWLPEAITIRKGTRGKSLRITWADGRTHVEVNLFRKAANKTQVSVQHRKLKDARAVGTWQQFWSRRLDRLQSLLERGAG